MTTQAPVTSPAFFLSSRPSSPATYLVLPRMSRSQWHSWPSSFFPFIFLLAILYPSKCDLQGFPITVRGNTTMACPRDPREIQDSLPFLTLHIYLITAFIPHCHYHSLSGFLSEVYIPTSLRRQSTAEQEETIRISMYNVFIFKNSFYVCFINNRLVVQCIYLIYK